MTDTKKIRDLKPGDMVSLEDGTSARVTDAFRNTLFEGNAWTVALDGLGCTMGNGDDVVALAQD